MGAIFIQTLIADCTGGCASVGTFYIFRFSRQQRMYRERGRRLLKRIQAKTNAAVENPGCSNAEDYPRSTKSRSRSRSPGPGAAVEIPKRDSSVESPRSRHSNWSPRSRSRSRSRTRSPSTSSDRNVRLTPPPSPLNSEASDDEQTPKERGRWSKFKPFPANGEKGKTYIEVLLRCALIYVKKYKVKDFNLNFTKV